MSNTAQVTVTSTPEQFAAYAIEMGRKPRHIEWRIEEAQSGLNDGMVYFCSQWISLEKAHLIISEIVSMESNTIGPYEK